MDSNIFVLPRGGFRNSSEGIIMVNTFKQCEKNHYVQAIGVPILNFGLCVLYNVLNT